MWLPRLASVLLVTSLGAGCFSVPVENIVATPDLTARDLPPVDLSSPLDRGIADLSSPGPAPVDAGSNADLKRIVTIGPHGGKVDLLRIGITGDTRPPGCTPLNRVAQDYPTDVINAIADAFAAEELDLVLDLGDHMCVCDPYDFADASAQMSLYLSATQRFGGPWLMTMGNHECSVPQCLPGAVNANYVAYMNALAPVSALPYYSVDIETMKGRVTIVVIADNAWSDEQQKWLGKTLHKADREATYTIVARHHPPGDPTAWGNAAIEHIVRSHKFALFLTGHDHQYTHLPPKSGSGESREAVFGIGGAIQWAPGAFHGYAILEQRPTGELRMSVYNVTTGALVDSWSVGPNPK